MSENQSDPIFENPVEETPAPPADLPPAPPPTPASPVKAAQIASSAPKPPRKGLLTRLFDPTTRFGRGMRAFTRALGATAGLFGLGMMVTYILFFQPLETGYAQLKTEMTQMRSELASAQSALSAAEAAQNDAQKLTQSAQARLDIQRAIAKSYELRLALVEKDNPAIRATTQELEELIKGLSEAIPVASGKSLQQVMELVKGDLTRSDLASTDLERLVSELRLLDKSLE